MKKKISRLLIAMIAAVTFASCKKEVPLAYRPSNEPKVVITSFICPTEKEITVVVKKSLPVFGSSPFITSSDNSSIKDASVIISEGGNSCKLQYDANSRNYKCFSAAFPIAEGKSYELSVTTAEGTFTAQTTVPKTITKIDSMYLGADNNDTSFVNSICYWKTNSPHIYKFAVQHLVKIVKTAGADTTSFYRFDDSYFLFINEQYMSNSTSGVLQFSWGNNLGNMNDVKKYVYFGAEAQLITCNNDYFNYHASLTKYDMKKADPFSEPVIIYSNMKGGALGAFGAYVMDKKKKKL